MDLRYEDYREGSVAQSSELRAQGVGARSRIYFDTFNKFRNQLRVPGSGLSDCLRRTNPGVAEQHIEAEE
jgi:hypothetical protein